MPDGADNRLRAMRGPDESFSEVIRRIAGETQGDDRL
jgi:predicted CopG family antitoxin